MSEINLFEQAARQKLRFASTRGSLSVEDLWDLPLSKGQVNLNDLAVGISRSLKDVAEESFVPAAKKADNAETKRLQLQLDLLKHVIGIKLEEQDARAKAQERAAKRQELMDALEEAQRGALKSKTPEELQAMLAALD